MRLVIVVCSLLSSSLDRGPHRRERARFLRSRFGYWYSRHRRHRPIVCSYVLHLVFAAYTGPARLLPPHRRHRAVSASLWLVCRHRPARSHLSRERPPRFAFVSRRSLRSHRCLVRVAARSGSAPADCGRARIVDVCLCIGRGSPGWRTCAARPRSGSLAYAKTTRRASVAPPYITTEAAPRCYAVAGGNVDGDSPTHHRVAARSPVCMAPHMPPVTRSACPHTSPPPRCRSSAPLVSSVRCALQLFPSVQAIINTTALPLLNFRGGVRSADHRSLQCRWRRWSGRAAACSIRYLPTVAVCVLCRLSTLSLATPHRCVVASFDPTARLVIVAETSPPPSSPPSAVRPHPSSSTTPRPSSLVPPVHRPPSPTH